MADSMVVGVDVGGTHITAAQVNLKARVLRTETLKRAHVNAKGSPEEIIHNWAENIKAAVGSNPTENVRVGIAMPGPFDYENGISQMQGQDKYDSLYGMNIKELLANALQIQPAHIRFMNDAGCFLQGEAFGGAATGVGRVIGLTLGTGLGSAIYKDGLASDAALWCSPYKEGIAEDYLSTRWFVNRFLNLTGVEVQHVKSLVELLPKYPQVQQVFDEFGQELGHFLVPYIQKERAELIVVGGNISRALNLFMPQLQHTLVTNGITVPIKQAQLGEEAALIGAASLWGEKMV